MTRPRRWMRAANFGDVIAGTAALHPRRTALIADDMTLSYADLTERANRFAGMLGQLGVGRQDVVALALGNDHRFVECLLGTLRAGAVALLVNTKQSAETIDYVLEHSAAEVVVGGARGTVDLADYERLLAAADPATASAAVEPDDLAILMYTSGSTGPPKGVMLSHSNTWWQARSNVRAMQHDDGDRGLVMGPLYHANALWAALFPMLHTGGSVVILPEFQPRRVLDAIEQHRVTYTSGTPSMYALLLAEDERDPRDMSSVELLECGSAPVPAELMARITERFRCDLAETYGLSEGGANILTPRWGIKKLGSTGLPVPDAEIRIVDSAGRDCAAGEVGELWTRSPANALGYLHDPATTAQRFHPDGWLATGDLFRSDEQGYCYFCGRTDDMISVGGENVYPKEVETVVLRHPAVADVGVVPAAHPVKGEAPVAWVVLRPGHVATEADIKQHALANGPAYAHPRRVFFLDALPVSGTNKLDRRALQRMTTEQLPTGLTATPRPDVP